MNPLPDWLGNLDTQVVGGLGELVHELVDSVVAFLILLTEGCVDASPVFEIYILLLDLFDLEESVFDVDRLASGGDDLRWRQFDGFDGSRHVVSESGIDQVVLVVEELLGERLDTGEPVLWLETGVLSDLIHKSLVLSLLGVEAGHPAELWNQVDELVVGVLLDDKERLVHITDLDVVVLEVVIEEGLVGVLDAVLWRLLDIDGVDSVDSVVTVVSEDGATDDFLLEKLFDVDSLTSVSATFSGLVEQFFHLVIYRVVSEDSAGEVDEHPDLQAVVDIDGGLVAGPNIERGFGNLVLEIFTLLIELGVRTNFEEVQSAEHVLDHDVQELDALDGGAGTLGEVIEIDLVVVDNGEVEFGSLFSAGYSK